MKTVLLAIFAVACLAGQAALAQASLPTRDKHVIAPESDRQPLTVASLPPR